MTRRSNFTFITATTQDYGPVNGCYTVTMPSAHATSDDVLYDYAVFEFNDGVNCSQIPGNTTGYVPLAIGTDSDIHGAPAFIDAYDGSPMPPQSGSYTYLYPTLITRSGAAGRISVHTGTSYRLDFTLDMTPGASGSGLHQDVFQSVGDYGEYVTGVWKGWDSSTNFSRRADNTVATFVDDYSNIDY